MVINIAKDFTETPGGRYKKDGPYSGEMFLEKHLLPLFNKAPTEKIIIDLDGGYGYPVSFLEEAFGGLARKVGKDIVKKNLEFISLEEPNLPDEIRGYIENA